MTGNFFVVEVLRRVEISRVEISIRVKKGIGEGKTLLVTAAKLWNSLLIKIRFGTSIQTEL